MVLLSVLVLCGWSVLWVLQTIPLLVNSQPASEACWFLRLLRPQNPTREELTSSQLCQNSVILYYFPIRVKSPANRCVCVSWRTPPLTLTVPIQQVLHTSFSDEVLCPDGSGQGSHTARNVAGPHLQWSKAGDSQAPW